MNDLLPKNWEKVHHAYIISGTDSNTVWQSLETNLLFKKQANPDAYAREYETLGIDEVREISDWAINKPIGGGRKVAVVFTSSFTTEAQNALLKLFEEPPSNTYFFVIMPNIGFLLPTLSSRVRTLVLKEEEEAEKKLKTFLEAPIAERLKMIAPIIKNKDKERARNLVRYLEQKISKLPTSEKKSDLLNKILQSERFISMRGGGVKLILEYLAVSI